MSLYDRVRFGLGLASKSQDTEDFQSKLDQMYHNGELDQFYVNKAQERTPETRIKAYKDAAQVNYFYTSLMGALRKAGGLPKQGDPSRDAILSCFWQEEPILSGAVYSMSAKMTALRWTITGRKNLSSYHAQLLARAVSMGPKYDWGDFIAATAQDFYTTDRGAFWETARTGSNSQYGRLADLAHIDALMCTLTGAADVPMIYHSSLTGQRIDFKQGEFIHFSSLKSPREDKLGIGFCAVSRAYVAAKLLLGLHKYDEQKLENLPPEGLAAINGLTKDEFTDALELWRKAREQNNSLQYPGVLWLLASMPNVNVGVDFVGFSQMPESFERRTVVEQYVNLLALDFGVDAREFWPISTSSMGTAAESEIQHLKAKGKGPGEFISIVERQVNGEFPEGVVFAFDTQDISEDLQKATIAKAWIDALLPLTGAAGGVNNPPTPKPDITQSGNEDAGTTDTKPNPFTNGSKAPAQPPQQKPFISRENFLRLLADHGVLPNWMATDDRTVVFDSSVQEKEWHGDDWPVIYEWNQGTLSVKTLPPYTLVGEETSKITPSRNGSLRTDTIPEAQLLKQLGDQIEQKKRNIRGKPIPTQEAERGNSVTANAVLDEIERWRNSPLLREYVPDASEGDIVQEIISNVEAQG